MSDRPIVFPCLEITQPIGTFYIGVLSAQDAIFLSKADIRKIEHDDIALAVGIQRKLSSTRLKDLSAYVRTMDAAFPTSIILAVDAENATYNEKKKEMTVPRKADIASVIDGQHRLKGLEGFKDDFQLNVTIFVDMETQDKANIFAAINLAQTKVNKSLVYDLYSYATSRSPQKTCHEIAMLVNYDDKSPFFRKIKVLGVASGTRSETISQATFVESLIEFISDDALADRDQLKRKKKLKRVEGRQAIKLCFRNLFIDKKDAEIAKIVWNYYDAVGDRWSVPWHEVQSGVVLNRTTGFRALMRFLRDVYVDLGKPGAVPSKKYFSKILDRISIPESAFTPETFKPGGSGEKQLLKELREKSGIPDYSKTVI